MELINSLEHQILAALQAVYDAWGWWGVAVLLVFENATGITPSEIILGLAGWMLISQHQLPATLIFIGGFYAAVGSSVGASITYWVARLGGRPVVDKMAHLVRISPAHITRAEEQFHQWGAGIVLVGRVIPGIRTLVSIPAGLARMPYLVFLTATFVGAYVWCTLLIGVGYVLGHEWALVSHYLKEYFPYLAAAGAAALFVYFVVMRRSMLRANRSSLTLSASVEPVRIDD